MINIIKMQLLKTGMALFCLLLANGLMNFAISLEFLKETGSSISFGLGLIIGPITGVIVAFFLMRIIDKYPKKTLSLIGIIGVSCTSLLFILLLYFTSFPFTFMAVTYLILTGVFIRLFNLSFLASNLALVGEKNLEKASAIEQGVFSLLVIIQPALAAFLWDFYGIKYISLFAFPLTIIPFFLVLSMNFSRFNQEPLPENKSSGFFPSIKLLFNHELQE